ncbi:hypothetical protein PBI_ARCHERS7_266 [Mycobacterium phage ArcherS7]|uniref:Uncharacterized protein n=21 Tax=Bixzunavirus TaxID=680114 RepID=R4TAI9_9CAUD|nr:hypothetical protein M181_gp091 [Mycobacterium phage Gizmo]YP_008061493.1 hypothetical protein M180_gp087 [Mycobacterium phage ArcherS7]YP_008061725.1 hypothetical protein M182_gp085 [Mycobacterium phage Astraea]YP_009013014.1 hypothetical protein DANDELION_271 [Mycobacterium phage Dandelion]YP_009018007.1 hypothetical protein PLEIONE_269 [Mycobacterium phage Pleione]YP_009204787.1 hypothetical protein HYRO_249 [Mycobacterium phage HyRo]YP_009216485.1 hypothetical protein ALICE_250 [Mycoba
MDKATIIAFAGIAIIIAVSVAVGRVMNR